MIEEIDTAIQSCPNNREAWNLVLGRLVELTKSTTAEFHVADPFAVDFHATTAIQLNPSCDPIVVPEDLKKQCLQCPETALYDGPLIVAPVCFRQQICGLLCLKFESNVDPNHLDHCKCELEKLTRHLAPFARLTQHTYHKSVLGYSGTDETLTWLTHHVKNVFQGISGGVHVMEDGFASQDLELAANGWDIVKRNQSRVLQLLFELLDSHPREDSAIQWLDLDRAISLAIERIKLGIKQPKVLIECTTPSQIRPIFAAPTAITRLFQALFRHILSLWDPDAAASIQLEIQEQVEEQRYLIEIRCSQMRRRSSSNAAASVDGIEFKQDLGDLELTVAEEIINHYEGELIMSDDSESSLAIQIQIPKSGTDRLLYLAGIKELPATPSC